MIKENILRVRERISSACSKINKETSQIALIAVSKGRTVGEIKEVILAGITDIGENRIQEAIIKYSGLRTQELTNSRTIKWHMVGHLQTNKVKEAVRIFDLIHSVDSLHLALEIEKQAAKINKVQNMLIEVNTSEEASKFGIKPEELSSLVKAISGLKNVCLQGLMTIAPIVDNPEKARPYFRMLRELRDRINELRVTPCLPAGRSYELRVLSMGMTDDFEVAIEEGSNMVRIGRAIFDNL